MMSPDWNSETPEMMGEFYSKLKNISVEYIRCLEDKWKMENVLLKEKEEWMEKEYGEKKVLLEQELEESYEKGRRDEMEKYKLRCSLDDKRERINNLEEELFDYKQTILNY